MTTAPSTPATPARPAGSAGAAHAQSGARRPGAANGQSAGGAPFAQLLREQTDTATGPATAAVAPESSARPEGDAAPDEAKGRARREDAAAADPSAPAPSPWPPQPASTVEKAQGTGPDRDGSDPLQALADAKGAGARRKAGAATAAPAGADAAERRGQADATGRPEHPRAGVTDALAVDAAAVATAVKPAAADAAPARPEAQVAGQVTSLGAVAERQPAPATPTPEAVVARASLPEPPGTPAFGPAVGLQLSTWLAEGVQHASLELHPEELGPIDVRIAVQEGRTEVALVADVATTRQALAEALPQLAAALGDVGLSLSGGSVSDQGRPPAGDGPRQDAQNPGGRPGAGAAGLTGGGAGAASAPAVQRRRQGLLDLYA